MRMRDAQKEILENKKRHNFNTTNIEQEFCYLYGEVREAYEAYAKGWNTFGEELADVTNFSMGIAEILGINLEKEILHRIYGVNEAVGISLLQQPQVIGVITMREMQRIIHKEEDISIMQRFCDLYGIIGDTYEAYYKEKGNFEELLVEVILCVMRIAEQCQIDLGCEIVQKVEKNKNRKYKRNVLGYMVHL